MVQSRSQNPVQDAIEESRRSCRDAVEQTPEAYRGFLTFIGQNKRVGGNRQNPQFATIKLPYMGVGGRVKMAQDEHREKGGQLTITTCFENDDAIGQVVCRAVITSSMLGTATGHAKANIGGTGVDASNPLENAESSAIGRALGFMGYGLFGNGIASAEEVLSAQAEQAESRPVVAEVPRPSGDMTGAPPEPVSEPAPQSDPAQAAPPQASSSKPPSDKQLGFLHKLMVEAGNPEDVIEKRIQTVKTSAQASSFIQELQEDVARQKQAEQAEDGELDGDIPF